MPLDPSHDPRRGATGGAPGTPHDADDPDGRLDAREQDAIDRAVVSVGQRGVGPLVVAALVLAAFVLGLVRPWDLLAPSPDGPGPGSGGFGGSVGSGATGSPRAGGPSAGADASFLGPDETQPVGASRQPTCGYPVDWRTAAIQEWAGKVAQVWTAVDAVAATGPDDPAIEFTLTGANRVEAIGWCAPVRGPERPPLAAVGSLFRLTDGAAEPVAFVRLEPATNDALGELWGPQPGAGTGDPPAWPDGRYVVRLATPDETYVRYLGIQIGVEPRASPSPGESGDAPPSASGEASPGP